MQAVKRLVGVGLEVRYTQSSFGNMELPWRLFHCSLPKMASLVLEQVTKCTLLVTADTAL